MLSSLKFVWISLCSYAGYVPCPCHPFWFDHSNNIWQGVQIMKFLLMHLFLFRSSASCSEMFSAQRWKSDANNIFSTRTFTCSSARCCGGVHTRVLQYLNKLTTKRWDVLFDFVDIIFCYPFTLCLTLFNCHIPPDQISHDTLPTQEQDWFILGLFINAVSVKSCSTV